MKITRIKYILSRLFPIKPNEWESVIYFFLVLFIFSFGAGFARSVGITLLIQNLGGEILPIMFICVDLLVMVGSLVYAHYTRYVHSLKILRFFFMATALFSALAQVLFLLATHWSDMLRWVYGFFFVGFGFFYIIIYIHVSSVIASYFTTVQTKRVTSIINTGIPLGGMLGGTILIIVLNVFYISLNSLVIVPGLACLGVLWLLHRIDTRLSLVRAGNVNCKSYKTPFAELSAAFKHISHSQLMLFMSLGLMTFVIASKLLEYQYQAVIYPHIFSEPNERATFLATYELFANFGWLLIQLFLTSRIIIWLGVGASNVLYPVLAMLVALALFIYFHSLNRGYLSENVLVMLSLGIFTQFINQEMRGALRAPTHNLLYNAIPPNLWGINKAFINGIIFPFATIIASVILILTASTQAIVETTTHSSLPPLIAMLVSIFGILIAVPQWAAYNKGVFGLLNRELFDRRIDIGMLGKSSSLRRVIETKLTSTDYYHVVAALEIIRVLQLNHFTDRVGNLLLKSQQFEVKARCIETLAALPQTNASATFLIEALKIEQDERVLPLILRNVAQFKIANFNATIEKFLYHPSAAVFVEASLCLHGHPQYNQKAEIEKEIIARLSETPSTDTVFYLQGLGQLRQAHYSDKVLPFLEHERPDICVAAFTAYIQLLEGQLESHKPLLLKALNSPLKEVKIAALRALKECQPLADWNPIIELLGSKDRTLVIESKELLRLNLVHCKNSLIEQAFAENISVQQRFEVLALIYAKLNKFQRDHLHKIADHALKQFIYVSMLTKLHESRRTTDKVSDLITKVLREIAECHLLHILTIITFTVDENFVFFQRVSKGLTSPNRANQGNALEVLSNLSEKYLTHRLIRYFEERPTYLKDFNAIHIFLFSEPLTVTEKNYGQYLAGLNSDMLTACLLYRLQKQEGRFDLTACNEQVKRLLLTDTSLEGTHAIFQSFHLDHQDNRS